MSYTAIVAITLCSQTHKYPHAVLSDSTFGKRWTRHYLLVRYFLNGNTHAAHCRELLCNRTSLCEQPYNGPSLDLLGNLTALTSLSLHAHLTGRCVLFLTCTCALCSTGVDSNAYYGIMIVHVLSQCCAYCTSRHNSCMQPVQAHAAVTSRIDILRQATTGLCSCLYALLVSCSLPHAPGWQSLSVLDLHGNSITGTLPPQWGTQLKQVSRSPGAQPLKARAGCSLSQP